MLCGICGEFCFFPVGDDDLRRHDICGGVQCFIQQDFSRFFQLEEALNFAVPPESGSYGDPFSGGEPDSIIFAAGNIFHRDHGGCLIIRSLHDGEKAGLAIRFGRSDFHAPAAEPCIFDTTPACRLFCRHFRQRIIHPLDHKFFSGTANQLGFAVLRENRFEEEHPVAAPAFPYAVGIFRLPLAVQEEHLFLIGLYTGQAVIHNKVIRLDIDKVPHRFLAFQSGITCCGIPCGGGME